MYIDLHPFPQYIRVKMHSSDYDGLGNSAEQRDTATGGITIQENERLISGNGWVSKSIQ